MTVYGMSASLAFASGSTSIPLEVHDDKTVVAFTVGQSALMEEVQRRHPQARVIEVVSDHGNVDGAPSSSATADALAAYFTSISIEEARRLEEATVLGELVEVARTVEKLTLVGGAEGESPLFLSIVIGAPAVGVSVAVTACVTAHLHACLSFSQTIKSRYGSESDEYATVVRAVEELVQKVACGSGV